MDPTGTNIPGTNKEKNGPSVTLEKPYLRAKTHLNMKTPKKKLTHGIKFLLPVKTLDSPVLSWGFQPFLTYLN